MRSVRNTQKTTVRYSSFRTCSEMKKRSMRSKMEAMSGFCRMWSKRMLSVEVARDAREEMR